MEKTEYLNQTPSYQRMATLSQIQELAAFKKRTWRRATIEQRKEIEKTFDRTGSLKAAFANVHFSKISTSDLTFDTVGGMHVGGRR